MKGQRFLEVKMTDFMNVVIAEGEFKEGLNLVGGENASGKTSFIRALIAPFAGKTSLPPLPVRQGALNYKIKIKLTDYNIELKGGSDSAKLKVTRADGGVIEGTPLQFLKDLINNNPFFVNLDMFFKLQPKEVAPFLKKIFNVDTSEFDNRIQQIEIARYDHKKDKQHLESAISSIVPSKIELKFIESKDVAVEIDRLEVQHNKMQKTKNSISDFNSKNEALKKEIVELETIIEKYKKDIEKYKKDIEQNNANVTKLEFECSQYPLDLTEQILIQKTKLVDADKNNTEFRQQKTLLENIEKVKKIEQILKTHEENLQSTKEARSEKIKKQGLDIEGLEFVDNTLIYKKLPIEQLSSAELDILFIRIASRLFKEDGGRFLTVQNGSDFDKKRLQQLKVVCIEENIQLVVEHPYVEKQAAEFYFSEGRTI